MVTGQNSRVDVGNQPTWSKWFDQIVAALAWPKRTEIVSLGTINPGQELDVFFPFPQGSIQLSDFPLVSVQDSLPTDIGTGLAWCAFTVPGDLIVVRFFNYSAAPIVPWGGLPKQVTVTALRS
jgi:hypothetical protein